jgi:hypothetical protein
MDEVIRAIEKLDPENMQDVLDAVEKRHRKLYPKWEFVMLSLPKDHREAWTELIEKAVILEEKSRNVK